MKKKLHNDYEIIERIKQGCESSFELLVENYKRFISKKIYKFNLYYDYEDTFQEGLILLYKTALAFDPSFNKTFTRFFEMSLERYLITRVNTIIRRKDKMVRYRDSIAEFNHCIKENSVYYELHLNEIKTILTPLEFLVFEKRHVKMFSIDDISKTHELTKKKIYNSLQRAKEKIQRHFNKE